MSFVGVVAVNVYAQEQYEEDKTASDYAFDKFREIGEIMEKKDKLCLEMEQENMIDEIEIPEFKEYCEERLQDIDIIEKNQLLKEYGNED